MKTTFKGVKLNELSSAEKSSVIGGKDSSTGRDQHGKDSSTGRDQFGKDSSTGRDQYSKDSSTGRDQKN